MSSISYTFGTDFDPNDGITLPAFTEGALSDSITITASSRQLLVADNTTSQNTFYTQVDFNTGFSFDLSDQTGTVTITGGNKSDIIRGGSGNNTLNGGGGNDIVIVGSGSDLIDGGTGINTVSYQYSTATIDVNLSIGQGFGGDAANDHYTNIQDIRGGSGDDTLVRDGGKNIIEGGTGADTIQGNGGSDVASYQHSSQGVTVDLRIQSGSAQVSTGDASGDELFDISNLYGSTFADTLKGDGNANTLNGGGGGADTLYGFGGDDRLAVSATPRLVNGGAGMDTLLIQGTTTVVLTAANFVSIERVGVANGSHVDMSALTSAPEIISTSLFGSQAVITASQGADRIVSGHGSDYIDGGAGNDKIFLAPHVNVTISDRVAGFGRDTIYGTDLVHNTFDVSGLASSMNDLRFYSAGGGADTVVKGIHDHLGDALVLKGITAANAAGGQFTFF